MSNVKNGLLWLYHWDCPRGTYLPSRNFTDSYVQSAIIIKLLQYTKYYYCIELVSNRLCLRCIWIKISLCMHKIIFYVCSKFDQYWFIQQTYKHTNFCIRYIKLVGLSRMLTLICFLDVSQYSLSELSSSSAAYGRTMLDMATPIELNGGIYLNQQAWRIGRLVLITQVDGPVCHGNKHD